MNRLLFASGAFSWCFWAILIHFLKIADDFVAMFRARTCYKIVEPAHMVLFIALYFNAFFCGIEKWNLRIYPIALEASSLIEIIL